MRPGGKPPERHPGRNSGRVLFRPFGPPRASPGKKRGCARSLLCGQGLDIRRRLDSQKNQDVKVAAIIPARHASTRFPGKPLAPVAGKPLLQWVWEGARQSRRIAPGQPGALVHRW
ncbi:MAG: hypothetical protein EBZ83_07350 [Verrucomicrobia bacterium]|nr:hypothetical protein [Verrucomicrobiota bacterium]